MCVVCVCFSSCSDDVISDGWQVVLCVSVFLDVEYGVQCYTPECKHCSYNAFCSFTTVGVQRVPVSGTLVCCVVNERPPQSGGAREPHQLEIVFFRGRLLFYRLNKQSEFVVCCGTDFWYTLNFVS